MASIVESLHRANTLASAFGTGARNLAGAIAIGLLIAAIEFAATRGSMQFGVLDQVGWLLRLSLHWGLAALPLGLTFTLAEKHARGIGTSRLAYAFAVITGAVAGAIVMALHGKFVDPAISRTLVGFDMALTDRFLYGVWQLSFWGTVGAALHAADGRRRRSADALRQGELARLRSERRLDETRLAALHAQFEPEFMLATLDTVERLYARDVAAADGVLDALIQFLREATPSLRRQTSSVEQECRLLQMYLRVPVVDTESVDALSVTVEPHLLAVAVPPGMLVALAQATLGAVTAGRARFEVSARLRRGALQLDLSAHADHLETTPDLRRIVERTEQRLASTPGARGSVTLAMDGTQRLTFHVTLVDPTETPT